MSGMSDARKARLIGACVLVLVGFVLLSWLLGSGNRANAPATAQADDTVIVLPARPLRTAQVGAQEPAAADEPDSGNSADRQAQPASAEQPAEPQSAPDSLAESEPAKPTARQPVARQAEPAAARQGWFVQLGVFGSRSNASALANKAREGDYRCEVRTLKQGGTTLHRVLVGPYPSEAAAELRVPKLQRWLGETGRVVALERGG